jgi:tetratricopeptide (TPR) repeat protein
MARFRWLFWLLLPLLVIGVYWYWQSRTNQTISALNTKALDALRLDEPEEAKTHLEGITDRRPFAAEPHFLLARAHRKMANFDAAEEHLTIAENAGFPPDRIEVERSLARAQKIAFDPEEPYLLHCLVQKHPDSDAIYDVITRWYFGAYYFPEATTCVQRWLDISPTSPVAWYLKGELLLRYARFEDAADAFQKAMELKKDRKYCLSYIGATLDRRKNPESAKAILEELLQQTPTDTLLLSRLGEVYEALGQPQEAKKHYDQAMKLAPKDWNVYFLKGRLELEAGTAEAARDNLKTALELCPNENEQILFLSFRALSRTGPVTEAQAMEARWKACLTDFKKLHEVVQLMTTKSTDPDLRSLAGELCLRNRRTEDGIRWLYSALKLAPNHQATHEILATHYRKTGQAELAQQHESMIAAPAPK